MDETLATSRPKVFLSHTDRDLDDQRFTDFAFVAGCNGGSGTGTETGRGGGSG